MEHISLTILIENQDAIASLLAQQAKIIEDVAKNSEEDLPSLKELAETQKAMAKTMELQAKTIDRQYAMVLGRQSGQNGRPTPASFPKFHQLPPEIRQKVWEMALPGVRVWQVFVDEQDQIGVNDTFKPPTIRGVCKESWTVTEQHGTFEFSSEFTRSYGLWFNPRKDIVVLGEDSHVDPRALRNVQNIAMNARDFSDERDCVSKLSWALNTMPNCRKIVLFTRPQLYCGDGTLSNINLFSLRDDDVVWSDATGVPEFYNDVDDSPVTWARVKEVLQGFYRKKWTLRRLNITEMDLPEIEGKEMIYDIQDSHRRQPYF